MKGWQNHTAQRMVLQYILVTFSSQVLIASIEKLSTGFHSVLIFWEFVLHFCSYLIIILIFVSSTNHVRHGLWDRCGWNCSESKDGSFQLLHAINTPVDAVFHFNGKKLNSKLSACFYLCPIWCREAPVATNAKQSYLFLLLTSPVQIGTEKDTHQLICPSYCPAPLPLMSAPTTNQALQQNPNSQTHHGEKNFQIFEKDPFHVHNI